MMIPGRFWNPNYNPDKKFKGAWVVPVTERNTDLLSQLGFVFKEEKKKEPERKKAVAIPPVAWKDEVLRDVDPRLREYQKEGVKMMQYFNFNCLLADAAGIGKSCQSLSAARTSQKYPVLIICPATLKINWKREIKMWADDKHKNSYYIVEGRKKQNFKNYSFVIINYNILYDHVKYITEELKPVLAIVDEVHEIRGRYKVVSKYYPEYVLKKREFINIIGGKKVICARPAKMVEASKWILTGFTEREEKHAGYEWGGIPCKILMTATPMVNNGGDLYNILNFLDKERFSDQEKFLGYFCTMGEGYKANMPVIKGSKNLDMLNKILVESYMIRRLKKDVLKELPPRIKTVVPQMMDDKSWKEYQQADEDFITWMKENKKKNIHTEDQEKRERFTTLQKIALEGKMKSCFKFIDNILLEKDKKVIVFGFHRETIFKIMEKYKGICVKLMGGMSDKAKMESVDQFQTNKKIRVFAGNLQSASVGITLHASDTVVFTEFGWLPHWVDQGIDRSHRFGLESDCMNAYFLPAAGTLEKMIITKLDQKLTAMEAGIDGKETKEEDLLGWLWEEYEKRT